MNGPLKLMSAALSALVLAGCGAGDPISSRFELQHRYAASDPQFRRTMDAMWGRGIVGGNSIATLQDAPAIYPAMLDAIRAAQHSINFELHTLWSGRAADEFIAALCERAAAGVPTHFIIDDAGSSELKASDAKLLEDAGVRLVHYNPLEKILLVFTAAEVNHRTHRKLLIVDGRIGFIGGVGIADLWLGDDGKSIAPWRDMMYRVEGPVVAQLQAAFMDNWMEAEGQVLDGDAYFPQLASSGDLACQVAAASPRDGEAALELMHLVAMNAATESIDIATPYFVPNELIIRGLVSAARRGVRVRIIVPGAKIDQEIVRDASRARWSELLDAGVELYEYQPAMYHCKLMIVDGIWTTVGSTNLDPRSMRLNDEANLNVYDASFSAQQIDMFERDIAQSLRITEIKHQKRSILKRIAEFAASLLGPQL